MHLQFTTLNKNFYQDQKGEDVYKKIQEIRQKIINLLKKIEFKAYIKKEYKEKMENYDLDCINKIISIISSKINTIKHKKIKENKINEYVIKKYLLNYKQKYNLNYNGSYQDNGLNAVNQNIVIYGNNLNIAISNLSKVNDDNKQNQNIKNDLAQIIFITSEAIRFGSYLKYFNYEKYGEPVEFKNILLDVQEIINDSKKI